MTLPTLPGKLVDRYEPQELLGLGAMGVVFAARDLQLGRQVALKIIEATIRNEDGLARFRREGRVLGQLSHPGIVRLFDADVADDVPYLVMELLQGRPLSAAIAAAPLPAPDVAALLDALLAALTHVHERGLLHRDLKPSNILMRSDGGPALIDFGLVRGGSGTLLTKAGDLLGTPRYLAPELLTGGAYSPASDLFALGMTAVEALTCADLHGGRGELAALISSLGSGAYHAAAVPLLARHGRLGDVLLRAIAPEPADRWPDAAAMREPLAQHLGASTISGGSGAPRDPAGASRSRARPADRRDGTVRLAPAPGTAPSGGLAATRRWPRVAVLVALPALVAVAMLALLGREPAPAPSPWTSVAAQGPPETSRELVAWIAEQATMPPGELLRALEPVALSGPPLPDAPVWNVVVSDLTREIDELNKPVVALFDGFESWIERDAWRTPRLLGSRRQLPLDFVREQEVKEPERFARLRARVRSGWLAAGRAARALALVARPAASDVRVADALYQLATDAWRIRCTPDEELRRDSERWFAGRPAGVLPLTVKAMMVRITGAPADRQYALERARDAMERRVASGRPDLADLRVLHALGLELMPSDPSPDNAAYATGVLERWRNWCARSAVAESQRPPTSQLEAAAGKSGAR